jgi:hypothetical protein
MPLRIVALFVVPGAVCAGLVLLLNGVGASAGVAVVSLGLVAVVSGAALGYFADQLPELPVARRRRARSASRLAGVHHGRR